MTVNRTFKTGAVYGGYKVTGRTEDGAIILYNLKDHSVLVRPLNKRDTETLGVEVVYVGNNIDIGCNSVYACQNDFLGYKAVSKRCASFCGTFYNTFVFSSLTVAQKQSIESCEVQRTITGILKNGDEVKICIINRKGRK